MASIPQMLKEELQRQKWIIENLRDENARLKRQLKELENERKE